MKTVVVIFALLFAVAFLVNADFGRGQTVRYDCRDAHWHPDVPVEVKRECQRILKERDEQKKQQRS